MCEADSGRLKIIGQALQKAALHGKPPRVRLGCSAAGEGHSITPHCPRGHSMQGRREFSVVPDAVRLLWLCALALALDCCADSPTSSRFTSNGTPAPRRSAVVPPSAARGSCLATAGFMARQHCRVS